MFKYLLIFSLLILGYLFYEVKIQDNKFNEPFSFNKNEDVIVGSFKLTDSTKKTHRIDSTKKNIYIFNIWTTWCVFCKSDINFLNSINNPNNIKIFYINMDDKKEYIQYMKKNKPKLTHPNILSWENSLPEVFSAIPSLPSTIIIYKGKIIRQFKTNLKKSLSSENFTNKDSLLNSI